MTMTAPFDPAALDMEPESNTRARNHSVEWGRIEEKEVVHDRYRLDPQFEPYSPAFGRLDRFTPRYDELPVHVTEIEAGVLFGQEFLVCDARQPTVSHERLYLTRHQRALRRLDLDRLPCEQGVTYLVGANSGHENFYHWNFQCLPGLLLLRQIARQHGVDYRIVLPPMNRVRLRSLELAGIAPSEWVILRSDQFISDVRLMYSTATCGHYALQPSARLIGLLDPYRDECLRLSTARLPTRFYVSRRDAPGKREVVNESALIDALRAHGHEELVMSELSLEDQVAAFARADSVVAPHGAGLVNLMFTPPMSRFLEILPENYRMAYFFRLAQVRGIDYRQVLSRVAAGWQGDNVHECPVNVDVERVVETLSLADEEPDRDLERSPRAA